MVQVPWRGCHLLISVHHRKLRSSCYNIKIDFKLTKSSFELLNSLKWCSMIPEAAQNPMLCYKTSCKIYILGSKNTLPKWATLIRKTVLLNDWFEVFQNVSLERKEKILLSNCFHKLKQTFSIDCSSINYKNI